MNITNIHLIAHKDIIEQSISRYKRLLIEIINSVPAEEYEIEAHREIAEEVFEKELMMVIEGCPELDSRYNNQLIELLVLSVFFNVLKQFSLAQLTYLTLKYNVSEKTLFPDFIKN